MSNKEIGPSFIDELKEYGNLVGQHFSWTPDGTLAFFEDTPAAVITGVKSVYAAHDPSRFSWCEYQEKALAALTDSDRTILRCYENSVIIPAEWAEYRKELRSILSSTSGDPTKELPVAPIYPEGT